MRVIDEITTALKAREPKISKVVNGTFTQYPNGTYSIVAIFTGTRPNDIFNVTASISNGTVVISEIRQTNFAQAEDTYDLIPVDSTDENYVIVLDFVSSQFKDYPKKPTTASQAGSSPIDKYKLVYTLANGSTSEVIVSIDSNTFTLSVLSVKQLSEGTGNSSPQWTNIPPAQIFTQMEFIMVKEYINRQSNGKFNNSNISSAQMQRNGTSITYKVEMEATGFMWEVVATINTNGYTTSGYT